MELNFRGNSNQQMDSELTSLNNTRTIRKARLQQGWKVLGGFYGKTAQRQLSRIWSLTPTHPKIGLIPSGALRDLAGIIRMRLFQEYKEQLVQTHSDRFVSQCLGKMGIKFESQYWIGNRNVDIFIPQIAGDFEPGLQRKMFGLAIEVNGNVHDHELKMRKDESLGEFLSSIGIGVFTVSNSDSEKIHKTLMELTDKKRHLDFRGKQRVLRRTDLETILHHATDDEFDSFTFKLAQKYDGVLD